DLGMTIASRTRDREEGAVAVEFAIVLPLLALMLFGIIEFGSLFWRYEVLVNAAREGGRTAAVRGDNASVRQAVTDADNGITLSQTPTIAVNGTTVADPGPACTSNNVGSTVTVSWTQLVDVSIPFFHPFTASLSI